MRVDLQHFLKYFGAEKSKIFHVNILQTKMILKEPPKKWLRKGSCAVTFRIGRPISIRESLFSGLGGVT